MKRYIIILSIFLSLNAFAQNNPISFKNGYEEVATNHKIVALGYQFDESLALLCVQIEGIKDAENSIRFEITGGKGEIVGKPYYNEKYNQYWISIYNTDHIYLQAKHQKYGWVSNELNLDVLKKMEDSYYVTTLAQNTVKRDISVSVEPKMSDVKIYLDGEHVGTTKYNGTITIKDVEYGNYILSFSRGSSSVDMKIAVDFDHGHFRKQLSQIKDVIITSNPTGAILLIDGRRAGVTSPTETHSLIYGVHTIEVYSSTILNETRVVDINAGVNVIDFQLAPKKEVSFTSTYAGEPVVADIVITDESSKVIGKTEKSLSSSFRLPYKKTGHSVYKVTASYNGQSKTERIRVQENSPYHYDINIPPDRERLKFWKTPYNETPFGVSVSYVSKQYATSKSGSFYDQDIWGDGGNIIHGIQYGVSYQMCFPWGLGFYTGLFDEIYFASKQENLLEQMYEKYYENALYMPIHAMYRIPLTRPTRGKSSYGLILRAGIGLQCGLEAIYHTNDSEYKGTGVLLYEGDYAYNRFNISADMGVSLRLSHIQINGTYSKGLNTVDEYNGYRTTVNKWSLGVSWMFDENTNWTWEKGYANAYPFGVSAGFVTKQFRMKYSHNGSMYSQCQDAFYRLNKFIPGFRLGVVYQPLFDIGIGFYTGLFYEHYFNVDKEAGIDYLNKYQENNIYLPILGKFDIFNSQDFDFHVLGGFGFDFGLSAFLSDTRSSGFKRSTYKLDNYPNRFNVYGELGVGFRVGMFQIDGTYSPSLTKIPSEEGLRMTQEKYSISASVAFEELPDDLKDPSMVGVSLEYVQKQWQIIDYDGGIYYRNLKGEEGWLPGLRLGTDFRLCSDYGVGGSTGIYGELYSCSVGSSDYTEISMYVPLHFYACIPFSDAFVISFNGGLGVDCSLYGGVDGYSVLGEDGAPDIFNLSAEIGARIRLFGYSLNFQYSKGFLNHDNMYNAYKTYQNKLSIGIAKNF